MVNNAGLAQYISSDYVYSMSVLAARDVVVVYVECWDDVAFWRNIFDDYVDSGICFEIMPPVRSDLAKGKKVVMDFVDRSGPNLFLAVDSDFDWIFDGKTKTSFRMKSCKWLVQTFAYSIENLQCVPSSLQSVLSRITRVDIPFFDFELFFLNYSKIIYKLFVWYVWSAFVETSHSLPLSKFAKAIKINFIDINSKGNDILETIAKSSSVLLSELIEEFPENIIHVDEYSEYLKTRGVNDENVYYFIQGHTFKDCVVKRLLSALSTYVVDNQENSLMYSNAPKSVVENEVNCYKNSIKTVESVLSENKGYKRTIFYDYISTRINDMIDERKL